VVYRDWRKALTMFPEAVASEVDQASLARSRRRRFPARVGQMVDVAQGADLVTSWSTLDESEPATFKDHLLLERDPNQLVEGRHHRGPTRCRCLRLYIFVRG